MICGHKSICFFYFSIAAVKKLHKVHVVSSHTTTISSHFSFSPIRAAPISFIVFSFLPLSFLSIFHLYHFLSSFSLLKSHPQWRGIELESELGKELRAGKSERELESERKRIEIRKGKRKRDESGWREKRMAVTGEDEQRKKKEEKKKKRRRKGTRKKGKVRIHVSK